MKKLAYVVVGLTLWAIALGGASGAYQMFHVVLDFLTINRAWLPPALIAAISMFTFAGGLFIIECAIYLLKLGFGVMRLN